jgi:hypothetical protein
MNLGISNQFGQVDLEHLKFPSTMSVDYLRVYQDPRNIQYGCDPDDFPTEAYIKKYVFPFIVNEVYDIDDLYTTGISKRTLIHC